MSIMVENLTENDVHINLNTTLAQQYYDNLKSLQSSFDLSGEITLSMLASMPDVLKAIPDVDDEAEMTECILQPVREAAVNPGGGRYLCGQVQHYRGINPFKESHGSDEIHYRKQ